MIAKKRVKKYLCYALSLIMLFSMVATVNLPALAADSQGVNIVNNGDMENSYWWYNSGSCSVAFSTEVKHGGNSSLKVTGRTQSWEGPGQNLTGNQMGDPVPGETYHGAAWVMFNGDTAPETVTFKLSIRWNNGTDDKYDNIKQLDVTKGQWTKLEGDYLLPSDAAVSEGVHIYVETTESATSMVDFYLDDVSLVGLNTVTPTPVPTATASPAAGKFHCFLLLGQSNMAGYPKAQDSDKVEDPRVLVLGYDDNPALGRVKDQWDVACPPLHENWNGIGPGDWFAKTMIQKYPAGDTIGLIPCAISGEKIETFMKDGGSKYDWIINRAKLAQQAGGVIEGILFHQGESNNGDASWPGKVKTLVEDLRTDLNLGDVPFIAGELLYSGGCAGHNTLVNQLPSLISNCYVVSASDLVVDPADTQWNLHFSHDSQVTLGKRYAEKMVQALGIGGQKLIALTFDDGPDNNLTPLVLDKLDKYNVPATFMMIGSKINDSTAGVVKRIVDSGGEIGNHSWGYSSMDKMTTEEIQKSVTDTTYAIQKYSGTTPLFFRPPNLSTSSTMFDAIDLTFVSGVTANDWVQTTTAQERADVIINGVRDGSIILLHDVQPLPHPTPEALDIIIPTLLSQGYEFVTLSELFKRKGVTLDPADNKMYVTVAGNTAVTGKDIVNNGDMENGKDWWYNRGSCAIESTSDEKHGGGSSLKVTGRTSSWQGPGQNLVGNEKGDPVAGKTYKGAAWVMFNGDTAPESVTFKLSVQWNDGTSDNYDTVSQVNVTRGQWTKLEGDYTIPDGAVFDSGIQLYVETTESDAPMVDFYIDDVSLIEPQGTVSLDGSDSLYSDFENGNTSGWTKRGNEKVALTEDASHNGNYGISVTQRTYGWNGPAHTLMGVVNFDKEYQISGYVMYKDGPDTQDFKISIQKTNGDGTTYTNVGSVTASKGKWALIEGDYTVDYDPTLTDIAVYFETPGNAADQLVDFYVDDIKAVGGDSLDYNPDLTALRSVWDQYFPLGAAVSPEMLESPVYAAYIKKHYASLTADNCMKPDALQPTEGQFDFSKADKVVDFAQANNMLMRGHTLLWHNQIPAWFFTDPEDSTKPATSEKLLERLKTHIGTVMTHFNGKIQTYDVANEVLSDSTELRGDSENSKWKSIVGDVDKDGVDDDYIIAAFKYAYDTAVKIGDDDVKFCINDYNLESSTKKVDAMYNTVSRILSKTGIPKDRLVVGFQMHISIYSPSIEQIRRAIEKIASLGVKVQVTEMDMSIYKSSSEPEKTATEDILMLQAKRYKDVFALFKDEAQKGNLDTVTLWGVDDGQTWLNDYPVKGRTDPCLLFNKRLQAKPAYTALVDPDSLPVYRQQISAYKGTPELGNDLDKIWGTIKATEVNQFVKGTEGATAKIKTMWDSQYLYVLAQVDDSTPNFNDRIEIFLDKNTDETQASMENVKHYTIYSNGEGSTEIRHYVKVQPGAYIVQAAIPVADISPAQGKKLGIDFRVNDDTGNEMATSIVVWNDDKNKLDTETSGYGYVVLDKEAKLIKVDYGTPAIDGDIEGIWDSVKADETGVWVLGTSGSTAKFKTLWDENNLYIMAEVTDSLLSKSSSDAYQQDSVEIFIDQDNAKNPYYEVDDYQIRVNYANEVTYDHAVLDGFKSATKTTETGYIVEAAVPLTAVKAEEGRILGFDLQVNNDQDGDGARDSVSMWCDPSGFSYKDVSGLGNIMFMEKKTGTAIPTPTTTPTGMPTPTPTVSGYRVCGYISTDFSFNSSSAAKIKSGFKVEIEGTGFSAVTDETGYFEINNVPEKNAGYTVKISKVNYLYRELSNVVVTGNIQLGSAVSPVVMWIGDLSIRGVQDGAINMLDVMYLASGFNTMIGNSRYSSEIDLDQDGSINMVDIMIIAKHFNEKPNDYPNIF